MGKLLLLFIAVPVLELALLIEIGKYLGILPTIALMFGTGLLGAFLARRQGLTTLREARSKIEHGEIPVGSLVDGVLILIAAALLITPGVLTDALGFLLLLPPFRKKVMAALLRRLKRAADGGRLHVHAAGFGFSQAGGTDFGAPWDPVDPIEVDEVLDAPKHRLH
jgi:UPF0716 protein FxsA